MGEAKRRAALAQKLGETRGDGFEDFEALIHDLRNTKGARTDQLDRLRFHELFSIALIEGCRSRGGDEGDGMRDLELMEAASIAAGVTIAATFFGRFQTPPPEAAKAFLLDAIVHAFSQGVAIGAREQAAPSAQSDTKGEM